MTAKTAAPNEEALPALIGRAQQLVDRMETLLPQPLAAPDWDASVAFLYRSRSIWGARAAVLEPVTHLAHITLADLREIEVQKDTIVRNTAQFVAGHSANNVLLTGARGTGKSSLVRACLHAFAPQGLRLIEVDKTELMDLPDIAALVGTRSEKFILFCDDLSFDEGESGYKALKSMLDGSIAAASSNVLIYATSNRRHLLPEYMRDNLGATQGAGAEIHPGEAVEEKISLSERFGLWVSFYPFAQEQYLSIVAQWLRHMGIAQDEIASAQQQALVWALERGSRSGRVAQQFARDYAGQRALR